MKRLVAFASIFSATLVAGCTQDHALGTTQGRDGGGATDDGSSSDRPDADYPFVVNNQTGDAGAGKCGSCSVPCTELMTTRFISDVQSNGSTVFVQYGGEFAPQPAGTGIISVASDNTSQFLVSFGEGFESPLAVGPNVVAFAGVGGPPTPIYTVPADSDGTYAPKALALADPPVLLDSTTLYYVDQSTSALSSIPLSGGPVTAVINSFPSAFLVAVDADAFYYSTTGGTTTSSYRQAKAGGPPTQLSAVVELDMGDANNFYEFSGTQKSLIAVPRNGGPTRTLMSWPSSEFFESSRVVATDGAKVYFLDPVPTGGGVSPSGYITDAPSFVTLRSMPVGGGATTTLCTGIENAGYLVLAGGALYVNSDSNSLLKLKIN